MNAVRSFETSVSVNPAPRRNVAQNANMQAVMCCNWTDGSQFEAMRPVQFVLF